MNNCAAAVLLAAAALGAGRETIVSRGQLIEIGGGFRIPELLAQAGTTLVEVGTTNRTRVADYARAIGERTGAILRAHPSNFRMLGFVEEVSIEALCGLGPPVIDDVGSGVLAEDVALLADEPAVRRSVAAGRGGGLLQRRQAARWAAGGSARRQARRDRRLPRATRSRARCGSTSSRSRHWRRRWGCTATRRRPARDSRARDARRAQATSWRRRARAGRGDRRTRHRGAPRGWAAVRCRCWSCRAPSSRSTRERPAPTLSRPRCAPATRHWWDAIHAGELLLDPRTLTDEEARWAARMVVAART